MASLNVLSEEKPREIAVRILLRQQAGGEYVEDLLDHELSARRIRTVDRALCQTLVFGAVRWRRTLDWLIAQKTAGRTQKEGLRVLLQIGLFQMFWLERIPNHAAVHETVEMAKRMGLGPQAGFLNAVLRGFARDLKVSQPPLGYSHPDWLVERWQARWGAENSARLLEWNNSPPPVYGRINRLKTDPVKLTAKWELEGVKFTAVKFDWTDADDLFRLDSHPPLALLKSFKDGWFYIQDPSTLLAVEELDPKPADSVLDLCAAPGGKTAFIAQRMQNRGRITAQDRDPERLDLIRENCERLGITCAEASLAPAEIIANPSAKFDRILVDAPCSNTGVMRRRVELRWRIQPKEIERLCSEQLKLLRQAAPRLKPGGILVYSTCSLEPEENSKVVQQFLAEHPGFRLEHERELLPFADGVDGAYAARFRKTVE